MDDSAYLGSVVYDDGWSKMKHLIKKFERLDDLEKVAVFATAIVVLTFVIALVKQGIFDAGMTGFSGDWMPFLHHSRIGAGMALIGSWMMLKKKNNTVGLWMVVIGLYLLVHHLATERCFSLLTEDGVAGGFC